MWSKAHAPELKLPALAPPVFRLVPQRVLGSAGVRFGVAYAALFGVSALALALFLWWSTAGLMERQTDDAINADSLGLSERYREGGTVGLLETINQRLRDHRQPPEMAVGDRDGPGMDRAPAGTRRPA